MAFILVFSWSSSERLLLLGIRLDELLFGRHVPLEIFSRTVKIENGPVLQVNGLFHLARPIHNNYHKHKHKKKQSTQTLFVGARRFSRSTQEA